MDANLTGRRELQAAIGGRSPCEANRWLVPFAPAKLAIAVHSDRGPATLRPAVRWMEHWSANICPRGGSRVAECSKALSARVGPRATTNGRRGAHDEPWRDDRAMARSCRRRRVRYPGEGGRWPSGVAHTTRECPSNSGRRRGSPDDGEQAANGASQEPQPAGQPRAVGGPHSLRVDGCPSQASAKRGRHCAAYGANEP